jgi:CDP-glucose 4,6-dehydratase
MEPLRGYMMLAENLYLEGSKFAEAWNFGPSDEDAKPVEWIANKLAKNWYKSASWQVDGSLHPHEANYLKLDISKARSRIGWHPIINLDHALRLIVDWNQMLEEGGDAKTISINQIKNYQNLLFE